jgi:adenylylsulfate kinase
MAWRARAALVIAAVVFGLTRNPTLSVFVGALEFAVQSAVAQLAGRPRVSAPIPETPVTPAVVWFTGLSGAGKSTISVRVYDELKRRGCKVELLDGDAVRAVFPNTGFTRPERDQHIRRVGYLAQKLEENGVFVVASFVSPYQDSRDFVRSLCANFIEVYLSTPLEVCESRDVKGLYARARRGEIANFTGIANPYEPPLNPDVTIDTSVASIDAAFEHVIAAIDRRQAS